MDNCNYGGSSRLIYKQRGLFHPCPTHPRVSLSLSLSLSFANKSLRCPFFSSLCGPSRVSISSLILLSSRCWTLYIMLAAVHDRIFALGGLTDFQEEEGRTLWKSAFASLARLLDICTLTKYAAFMCEKR